MSQICTLNFHNKKDICKTRSEIRIKVSSRNTLFMNAKINMGHVTVLETNFVNIVPILNYYNACKE